MSQHPPPTTTTSSARAHAVDDLLRNFRNISEKAVDLLKVSSDRLASLDDQISPIHVITQEYQKTFVNIGKVRDRVLNTIQQCVYTLVFITASMYQYFPVSQIRTCDCRRSAGVVWHAQGLSGEPSMETTLRTCNSVQGFIKASEKIPQILSFFDLHSDYVTLPFNS